MTTPKISVWAFNDFVVFDAFIAKIGSIPDEASPTQDRASLVKMVHNGRHFKLSVEEMLAALESHDNNPAELAKVRGKIFRKDGARRASLGRVKYMTQGMFVIFEF